MLRVKYSTLGSLLILFFWSTVFVANGEVEPPCPCKVFDGPFPNSDLDFLHQSAGLSFSWSCNQQLSRAEYAIVTDEDVSSHFVDLLGCRSSPEVRDERTLSWQPLLLEDENVRINVDFLSVRPGRRYFLLLRVYHRDGDAFYVNSNGVTFVNDQEDWKGPQLELRDVDTFSSLLFPTISFTPGPTISHEEDNENSLEDQEIGLIAVGVASLLLVIGGLTGALLLNWKDCRAFKFGAKDQFLTNVQRQENVEAL